MTKQEPRARASDPWTSFAAARSVDDLTEKQAAVFYVLATNGPMSLSQLVYHYKHKDYTLPEQSESGVRTRCSELMKRNLVTEDGYRKHDETGRRERVLKASFGHPSSPAIEREYCAAANAPCERQCRKLRLGHCWVLDNPQESEEPIGGLF